jgi:hypothetical protein
MIVLYIAHGPCTAPRLGLKLQSFRARINARDEADFPTRECMGEAGFARAVAMLTNCIGSEFEELSPETTSVILYDK